MEFMKVQFRWGFWGIILRFIRLEVSTIVFVFLQNTIHEQTWVFLTDWLFCIDFWKLRGVVWFFPPWMTLESMHISTCNIFIIFLYNATICEHSISIVVYFCTQVPIKCPFFRVFRETLSEGGAKTLNQLRVEKYLDTSHFRYQDTSTFRYQDTSHFRYQDTSHFMYQETSHVRYQETSHFRYQYTSTLCTRKLHNSGTWTLHTSGALCREGFIFLPCNN